MPILNLDDELKKMLFDYFEEAIKKFDKSVKPILTSDSENFPIPLGSGVLLEVENTKCFVTAAHVIDQIANGKIYTNSGTKIIPIAFRGFATSAPNGKRNRDGYDFAVAFLTDAANENLKDCYFINAEEISNNNDSCDHHCLAMGYPISRNKVSVSTNQVNGALYPYITKSIRKDGDFFYFQYDQVLHDKKTIDKPVNAKGMSGGAFIDLGPLSGWEKIIKKSRTPSDCGKLLGIIIEKTPKRKENNKTIEEIKTLDIKFIIEEIKRQLSRI